MAKKLRLNTYAFKLSLKETTDLGFGAPTNSGYNAILCATCMKLFEDEDMWYVPDSKEIFCEEWFDELLNYNIETGTDPMSHVPMSHMSHAEKVKMLRCH